MKALVCGSFDPITIGHIDIIKRAQALFGEVDAVIFDNGEKHGMLSPELRFEMLSRACQGMSNVSVNLSSGFLTDYCKENGISVIVRGVRSSADTAYEIELAEIYRRLEPEIETVFLSSSSEYSHISSTFARELIKYKKDLSKAIPKEAIEVLSTYGIGN